MEIPQIPINEKERLEALQRLEILDTPAEKAYDDITLIAAEISKMPIVLINLIDKNRQWAKAAFGINFCESNREQSICAHVINNPNEITEYKNITEVKEFDNNPLLENLSPKIKYYCGIPIVNKQNLALGTLCVIDYKPNQLSNAQKTSLQALAQQVMLLFELRKKNSSLTKAKEELYKQNELLKNFAGTVSHDMKMPLSNMILTIDLLKAQYDKQLDFQGKKHLDYIKQASFTLSDYISSILTHYETDKIADKNNVEEIDVNHLLEEVIDLFHIQEECEINFIEENPVIKVNKVALEQIFINLIGNSLKYNDKNKIIISLNFSKDQHYYYFSVTDNGIGIPEDKKESIFDLFSIATSVDRNGRKGNGIGLSTVKKLVEGLGGKITVESRKGQETSFRFSIQKYAQKKTA